MKQGKVFLRIYELERRLFNSIMSSQRTSKKSLDIDLYHHIQNKMHWNIGLNGYIPVKSHLFGQLRWGK